MNRAITIVIVSICCAVSLFGQQTTSLTIGRDTFQSMLLKVDGETFQFPITLPNLGPKIAIVKRFRVTDVSTKVTLITENGLVAAGLPLSVHVQGSIQGHPNSSFILSMFDGWSVGHIELEPGTSRIYSISPRSMQPYSELVVASESDLIKPMPWICATQDEEIKGSLPKKSESSQAVTLRSVKVALEVDFDGYKDHGNNSATATQYAEAVFAHSSSIYQRDVNATLYIGSMLVWTTADPYTGTSSSSLLTQFQNYWRTNRTNVDRDLAQLLSGVNDIGGVANLNGLCSNTNGYSVAGLNNNITYPRTTYAWDTDCSSHELGHNIGSPHTHSCSWNPPIDSCYFAEGSCFSTRKSVVGTIMSYCHLTPMGTELRFHDRVADLMEQKLSDANCVVVSALLTVNAGTDKTICSGTPTTLSASYSDGTAPVIVTWTPTAGMSGANTLTPTVAPTVTTPYIIEVRDGVNAVARDTVVVTVNPKLTVDIPNSSSFCRGNVLNVNAVVTGGTAPVTYKWTGWNIDTTTNTPSVALVPITSTRLYLNATDSKGCTAKDSMDIMVFNAVDINLNNIDTITCNGSNVTLTCTVLSGSPPYTFTWTGNGKQLPYNTQTITVPVDTATYFRLLVRDVNGCADSSQRYVNIIYQDFSAEPESIEVTKVPACDDEAEIWVMVRNTGRETIRITNVKGKKIAVSSRDLPFSLSPGMSHQMPILCAFPTNSITDTISIIAAQCGRVRTVVVNGVRDKLGVVNDSTPTLAAPMLYCTGSAPRTIAIDVVNSTNYDVQVNSISSRWFKVNATSFTPKTLFRKSTTTMNVTMNVPSPPGAILDTLDIHYRSSGCTGSFIAPIRIETAIAALSMPSIIDFGTISSAQTEVVSRDLVITPDIAPLDFTMVTDAGATAPFTTSFSAPTVLRHNVGRTEKVFFDPKTIETAGVVRGEVYFALDSCTTPFKVALVVSQVITDVNEEPLPQQSAYEPFVRVATGSVRARGVSGRVVVSDIRGVVYHTSEVTDGQMLDLSSVPNGVYVLVVTQTDGVARHSMLMLP